jgi:hypothetical protein
MSTPLLRSSGSRIRKCAGLESKPFFDLSASPSTGSRQCNIGKLDVGLPRRYFTSSPEGGRTSNYLKYTKPISQAARAGKAEQAEHVLHEMHKEYLEGNKSAEPRVNVFNMVLDAWSKSRSQDAPHRAEAVLSIMWQLFESGELNTKPNYISYSTVIQCWGKSREKGAGTRAEEVFNQMQERRKAGDKNCILAAKTYVAVIAARAWEGDTKRAEERK